MNSEDNLIDAKNTINEELNSLEIEASTSDGASVPYPDFSVNQAEISNQKAIEYPDFSVNKPEIAPATEVVDQVKTNNESIESTGVNENSLPDTEKKSPETQPVKNQPKTKTEIKTLSPASKSLPEMHGDIDAFLKALFKSEGGWKTYRC